MSNRISLPDIVNALAERSGMSKAQSEKLCRYFFSLIRAGLLRDNYVKIKGWGTFKLMAVSGRESVDVNTGQRIEISAHQKIVFTPEKTIASRINRPFENFETIELSDGHETSQSLEVDTLPEVNQDENIANDVHSVYLGDVVAEKEAIREEEKDAPENNLTAQSDKEDVQDESVVPVIQDEATESQAYDDSEDDEPKHIWEKVGVALLSVLLLLAAYFVGYYKLLGETDVFGLSKISFPTDTLKQENPIEVTAPLVMGEDSVSSTEQEDAMIEASKYEQLEDAEYLIVGELEVHEMKSGESIIRLAQKLYGDKEAARYVIHYNHISNPDVVHVGRKIVFPKLVRVSR